MSIKRVQAGPRMSQAVVHNGLVFLAGQVADDKTADIATQTRQALAKVDDMLARAGTDKSRLMSVQIWLRDMADFDAMNAVYDAWVVSGHTPSRACCGGVVLGDPALRIEIIAVAVR